MPKQLVDRRIFLSKAGTIALGCVFAPVALGAQQPLTSAVPKSDKEDGGDEVTPSEDLMREHGVLRRVLLVYEEFVRRLDSRGGIDSKLLISATDIVKNFVEDYHEKQEEDFVFPRLQKAGKQIELVSILLQQHAAGRVVTQKTRTLVNAGKMKPSTQAELKNYLQSFIRMYRPHAAREDTVLFPAFSSILTRNEYDSLGEQFEKNETKMFGEGGFEKFVDQVESIEKELGIYDLRQFTPRV